MGKALGWYKSGGSGCYFNWCCYCRWRTSKGYTHELNTFGDVNHNETSEIGQFLDCLCSWHYLFHLNHFPGFYCLLIRVLLGLNIACGRNSAQLSTLYAEMTDPNETQEMWKDQVLNELVSVTLESLTTWSTLAIDVRMQIMLDLTPSYQMAAAGRAQTSRLSSSNIFL